MYQAKMYLVYREIPREENKKHIFYLKQDRGKNIKRDQLEKMLRRN